MVLLVCDVIIMRFTSFLLLFVLTTQTFAQQADRIHICMPGNNEASTEEIQLPKQIINKLKSRDYPNQFYDYYGEETLLKRAMRQDASIHMIYQTLMINGIIIEDTVIIEKIQNSPWWGPQKVKWRVISQNKALRRGIHCSEDGLLIVRTNKKNLPIL